MAAVAVLEMNMEKMPVMSMKPSSTFSDRLPKGAIRVFSHQYVESTLGGGYGHHETAEEEDDGWVGKAGHHTLILQEVVRIRPRNLA